MSTTNGTRSKNRQEVVVLTQVLADELNLGYESLDNQIVKKVEGKLISDLASLSRHVRKAKDTLTIELANGCTIVLDAQTSRPVEDL